MTNTYPARRHTFIPFLPYDAMALFAVKIVRYRTFLLLYCYVLSFDNVATVE